MNDHLEEEPLVTDAEWQALMHGARALREVAAALRNAGFQRIAAENDGHASALEGLVQRATVAADRRAGQAAKPEAER
jgi:hypothetical protein